LSWLASLSVLFFPWDPQILILFMSGMDIRAGENSTGKNQSKTKGKT